ncbi:MAG TPA: response regulator [Pyrinomonadaceae bacterium]|nr:response regulator [Pyrinomonadaceae bacterium]
MSLAVANQSRRVLMAAHDPAVRSLLKSAFTRAAYIVVEARDGREAFRTLQSDADFAVAFLDFEMPKLSGIDLVEYMKSERRLQRIPVVLMSPETNLNAIPAGFAAGAMAVLHKPLTPQRLESALAIWL